MTDDERFRALYERHYPAVLGYCARRVGVEAARDATADTFLVAWRRLHEIDSARELPWLLRTAANVLRDQDRSARRRDRLAARLAGTVTEHGGDHAPNVVATADVMAALAQLRPDEQELLRLSAWDDLDPTTIAQVVGASPAAVRVRLLRARRRFARALDLPAGVQHALPVDPLATHAQEAR